MRTICLKYWKPWQNILWMSRHSMSPTNLFSILNKLLSKLIRIATNSTPESFLNLPSWNSHVSDRIDSWLYQENDRRILQEFKTIQFTIELFTLCWQKAVYWKCFTVVPMYARRTLSRQEIYRILVLSVLKTNSYWQVTIFLLLLMKEVCKSLPCCYGYNTV